MSRVLCPGDVFTLYDDVLIFVCCVEEESATGMLVSDTRYDAFTCKSITRIQNMQYSKIETIKRIRNVTDKHIGLKDAKEVTDMLTDTGPAPAGLSSVWRAS